jgi:hypothetical protein
MSEENTTAVRETWVNVLRSGKYTQGTCFLRNNEDNTFCCLGVLCDLVDPQGWSKGPYLLPESDRERFLHCGEMHLPVENIREAAGLTLDICEYLANLNDITLWSFAKIADEIEADFPNKQEHQQ